MVFHSGFGRTSNLNSGPMSDQNSKGVARNLNTNNRHFHSRRAFMAGDDTRVLLCLIKGDSEVFRIEVSKNADALDLKKHILECKKGTLRNVDAKDLVLWKVGPFQWSANSA
jgi:hypothetical protein